MRTQVARRRRESTRSVANDRSAWLCLVRPSCALWIAFLSGGCGQEDEVEWRVRFACEQAANDVVLVRTRILSGDCDGDPIYEVELPREGEPAKDIKSPGKLPSGSHGFEATSVDAAGEVISRTCRVVPASARAEVELLLSSPICEGADPGGGEVDGGPSECVDPTPGACDVFCDKGFWSNKPQSPCEPVANCPPGTVVTQEATATRDRVCMFCASGFSATENAAECTPWTECVQGEIELLAGSATHDRLCGLAEDCPPGTYDAGPPGTYDAGPPGTYDAGYGVDVNPTVPSSPRSCMACLPGTFSDDVNAPACTPFTTCGPGLEQVTPGSATDDVECRDVDGCAEADPTGDANPCNTQNLNAICLDNAAPRTGYTCRCTGGFEPSAGTCLSIDACPYDPNKTDAGACGCGTPETVRNGVVECTILAEDFESGLSNWYAEIWQTRTPAETQPLNHGSSNRVAHASGCAECELMSPEVPSEGATNLTLSFLRFLDSELDPDTGEQLEVWLYSRGAWIRLTRYRPPYDNDDQWHRETFDLTPYAANDLRISFEASTGLSTEDIEVDDVVVTLTP